MSFRIMIKTKLTLTLLFTCIAIKSTCAQQYGMLAKSNNDTEPNLHLYLFGNGSFESVTKDKPE